MTNLISVVVPTFNNAPLLPETLDGISRQSVKNVELIVIDDGSTDNTAQVVKSYDSAIIYCRQSNQGPAAARNKGVSVARGDYIAFCDHEVIWNEWHLESLLGCFLARSSTALAFDNAQYFGDPAKRPWLHLEQEISQTLIHYGVNPKVLLSRYPIASMSVVMVKKAAFQRIGGFNEGILALDDLHFYLRLASRENISYIDYVGCRK
jgi:glycosyltransferase involved in cell wall biosynthesis